MVVLNRIYTRTGDAGQTALGDGSRVRVLKNFPTEAELRSYLPSTLRFEPLQYYWLADYRLG